MQISKFERIFDKTAKVSYIHEMSMFIENTKGDLSWSKGYGGKDIESPMVMTSVSKLFTTTCILILREQGLLTLEDKLTKYFPPEVLEGIHVHKGIDYSNELTVANLLFQTSGFPDIYAVGKDNLNKQLIKNDFIVSFDEYTKITKEHKKKFAPSTPKRAYYSDMNFEMLGKIIEKLTEGSLHDAFKKFVFEPLKLEKTYMPQMEQNFVPNIYYKDRALHRPKLITCLPACGGCVSTLKEMMIFTKAFFTGKLFDKAVFNELSSFKYIQYAPLIAQYGGGFMNLKLDGFSTLFRGKGELIGHIGMSGAFAFYYPRKDIYMVGDVNQLAHPGLTMTVPMKLAMSMA